MRTLGIAFKPRGLGYVVILTLIVAATGAAGMYRFEFDARSGPGFEAIAAYFVGRDQAGADRV